MSVKTKNPFGIDLNADDLELLGEVADLTRERDPESIISNDLPVGVYQAALNGGVWAKTADGTKLKFTFAFTILGGDFHGKVRKINRVIKTDDGGDSYLRLRRELKVFGVDAINPVDIVEQLASTDLIEFGLVVTAASKGTGVFYNIVSTEALADYLVEE